MVQVRWTISLAPGIQPNIVKINSKFWLMFVTYQSNDQYISQQSADVFLVENSKDRSPVFSSRTAPLNVKQHLSFKIYKQTCSQCRGNHPRAHCEMKKKVLYLLGHTFIKNHSIQKHLQHFEHAHILLEDFIFGLRLQYLGPRRERLKEIKFIQTSAHSTR